MASLLLDVRSVLFKIPVDSQSSNFQNNNDTFQTEYTMNFYRTLCNKLSFRSLLRIVHTKITCEHGEGIIWNTGFCMDLKI